MIGKNTMSKGAYLARMIFWGVAAAAALRLAASDVVSYLPVGRSVTLLVSIMWTVMLVTYLCTDRTRRNRKEIALSVLLGCEVYLVLCSDIYARQEAVLVKAACGVSALAVLLIFLVPKPVGEGVGRYLARRLQAATLSCRTVFSLCLLPMAAVVLFFSVTGRLSGDMVEARRVNDDKSSTIYSRIDILSQLDEDSWEILSDEGKMGVLAAALDVECDFLGLPWELELVICPLADGVLGSYNDETLTVRLDSDLFRDGTGEKVLDTLAHECRHAYQHRLVDAFENSGEDYKYLLAFDSAWIFRMELEDYRSTLKGDGYEEYYDQHVEMDARAYAAQRTELYFDIIRDRIPVGG